MMGWMSWTRPVACTGEKRVLIGKPEGRELVGRPKNKWEFNKKDRMGWHRLD
jgi:hypothetical protein